MSCGGDHPSSNEYNPAHNATPNVTMAAAGAAALPSMAPRSRRRERPDGVGTVIAAVAEGEAAVKTCIQLNIKNVDQKAIRPEVFKETKAIHTAADHRDDEVVISSR